MICLATIIKEFEGSFLEHYRGSLLPSHKKALYVMKECRSQASPRMMAQCPDGDCEHCRFIPHSCGQRHCPHCQSYEGQRWIEKQLSKQLPVDYFLLTFTLPYQLRQLTWNHQRVVFSLFFSCVQKALQTFAKNDKQLAGTAGLTAILHTHSRRLEFHPHIHVVIPAGCVNSKSRLWRVKTGKYLFSQRALAGVFRAMLLKEMVESKLQVPKDCPKKWVVDCKNVGNGAKAFVYLGRYLYKGVIQEKDILACENGAVTFRYTESKTKQVKTRTVPGEEFLWLFLQHILPKGFRRVRSYGFLHPCSKRLITLMQLLLRFKPRLSDQRERPGIICPHCGAKMKIVRTLLSVAEVKRLVAQPRPSVGQVM